MVDAIAMSRFQVFVQQNVLTGQQIDVKTRARACSAA
jgi:hypothetical protein